MKKTALLSLLYVLCAFAVKAQIVSHVESTFDDYIRLLEAKGYESYSFDISGLSDSRYKLTFKVQEYVDGKKVSDNILSYNSPIDNMRMVSDFDEETQATILPEEMAVPERGIHTLADRISVGFAPADNDSTKILQLEVRNMGTRYGYLDLKPVSNPNTGKSFYSYHSRIFKPADIKDGGFVPLVLFGSFWFDEQANVFRFCGENEISSDMSEDIIRYIPNFYVIGVQIEPSSTK